MTYRWGLKHFLTATVGIVGVLASQAAWAEDTTELKEVTVLSEGADDSGPVAKKSRSASKTDTPISETPQSVSVVTEDQIEKQGATSVSAALRYEAGVGTGSRNGDRGDSLFIRGFGGFGPNTNYLQYWDGLRLTRGVSYAVPTVDPYLLERMEIMRGPASVLYGAGNPGGFVNVVSKKPSEETSGEVFTRIGNNGLAETGFDVTGAADQDGHLLYRFVGLGRLYNIGVENSDSEHLVLAPSFTWSPDADTTLTLQATYTREPNAAIALWMPALGTLQKNPNGQIASDFFSGNPNYTGYERTQSTIGYQFEHHFDDVWTVRQNLRFMHVDTDFKNYAVSSSGSAWASAEDCGGVSYLCLGRRPTHYIESMDALTVDNQAQADFQTGALEHTVLFGLDYQHVSADATYGTGATSYIDYLDPDYEETTNVTLTTYQEQARQQLGVYVQDQMKLGNWAFVLAGREDWSKIDTDTTTLSTGATTSWNTEDTAFTWKAGLLYQFDNGITPYASYTTSFEPVTGTGYGGVNFKPTTGQQYEVGIKYEPDGFPGLFTVALYDLTQQNVLTTDLEHTSSDTSVTGCSSTTCQTQTGEVRSRGVELSAKVEVLDNLNITTSYTYADVEVTKSNVTGVQGKVPVGVPAHMAGIWGDYLFSSGPLAGLSVGAGVRYVGQTYGDTTNTDAMRVPAYTLVDASLRYDLGNLNPRLDGFNLAFNATNLFDKKYVSACASANQCFYGAGRTVTATASYKW
jgi:iron complex outermembrane receptor protein